MPETRAYGGWKSPVTTGLAAKAAFPVAALQVDGEALYWIEVRPQEGGRAAISRLGRDGAAEDVTPAGFNARTMVHEYGGGSWLVHDGTLWACNFEDQRVYRVEAGQAAPLTPAGKLRFADFALDEARERLVCVCEDHSAGDQDCVNLLVSIPLAGGKPETLAAGSDFYASPRLSPDGGRLAWLSWNHPNMPWDGCELWVAELDADGRPARPKRVAGGPAESMFQPQWAPDGTLHFVSDRTGWWNLYRFAGASIEPVHELQAEFGRPMWTFGMSTYGIGGDGRIFTLYEQGGLDHLAVLDALGRRELDGAPQHVRFATAAGRHGYFAATSPKSETRIVRVDLETLAQETLWERRPEGLDGYLAEPQEIVFPTSDGQVAYALYYPPRNQDFEAPAGDKPPLCVQVHGGPTAAAKPAFDLEIQYRTSRGFALLDVNYRGSSGYGRAYREELKGRWGEVDVDDAIDAAKHLVEQGLADPRRVIVMGGSAGGYTTLCALAFRDFFSAGTSYYGVAELRLFDRSTHKFESRYLLPLIGGPGHYEERSPISRVDDVKSPLLLLQGLDDRIVPPSQAEVMVAALRRNRVPFGYLAFAGEGHGFRRAETIARCLEAELYFYSRIFGLDLAEPVEPIPIENL